MTSTYKDKRSTKSDGLYKLLLQNDVQVLGSSLSTKSTTQERKEMKMETKERRKLLKDNQKHIKRKQDSFLQSETLSYYENRRIRSYYRGNVLTKRKINSIYVENHESSWTKLRNHEKRDVNHHLSN